MNSLQKFIFCVPTHDGNDSGIDSSNSPRHGGVASTESRPQNLQELEEMLQEEWKKINVWDIQTLINSMPGELQLLLPSRAGTQIPTFGKTLLKLYTRNQYLLLNSCM